jgi:hypothetical protein
MKFLFILFIIACPLVQLNQSMIKSVARTMLDGKRLDLNRLSLEKKIQLCKELLALYNQDSIYATNQHYWYFTSKKDIERITSRIDVCDPICIDHHLLNINVDMQEQCQICLESRKRYFSQYYLSYNMVIFYLIEAIRLSNYEFESNINIAKVYKDTLEKSYYVPMIQDSASFNEIRLHYQRYLDTVSVSSFLLSVQSCETTPLYLSSYRWYNSQIVLALEYQAQSIKDQIIKRAKEENRRAVEPLLYNSSELIRLYRSQNMPLYFQAPCF